MTHLFDALRHRLGQTPPIRLIGVTDPDVAEALIREMPCWGWHPVPIVLSRYRKDRQLQGPAIEAIEAWDVALFRDQLYVLVEEKEIVSLAIFDETSGKSRPFGGPEVMLGVKDVLVLIGSLAHDPRWWESLLSEGQVWRL